MSRKVMVYVDSSTFLLYTKNVRLFGRPDICTKTEGDSAMDSRFKKVSRLLSDNDLSYIELREWRNSIILEGETSDYEDVVRAGRLAARKGYKGVINKITVKGLKEHAPSSPSIRDNSLDNMNPDVLVIGGGVIGCSIAREFSKYSLKVLVAEKESDVAMQASSRNDGMIHPGIATHLHGNTAGYNVRGNSMYTQLCEELDISFERRGNIILLDDKKLNMVLPIIKLRAKQLGIPSEFLDYQKLHKMEPHLSENIISGIMFPTSGTLSPYKLTVALAENAIENGVTFSLSTIVEAMELEGDEIRCVRTNRGNVFPRLVVNATGVFADKVAAMANDQFFTIHPRKGELAILDKKKGEYLSAAIGLLNLKGLSGNTKGGGLVHTIDGNLLAGPSAAEVSDREDNSTCDTVINNILKKQLPLVKGLDKGDIITYFAGTRAATYEESFVVEASEYVKNLVHAAGIQSPGLASAPAIAEDVVKMSVDILSKKKLVEKNPVFNPNRNARNMDKLSMEEKQQLIKQNPDYGIIVCRCEAISKGEIIDVLRSPLKAATLDGIKRRARPGMGRCQGGFCSPLVMKIISEETGIALTEVTKKGEHSNIVLEPVAKGIARKPAAMDAVSASPDKSTVMVSPGKSTVIDSAGKDLMKSDAV